MWPSEPDSGAALRIWFQCGPQNLVPVWPSEPGSSVALRTWFQCGLQNLVPVWPSEPDSSVALRTWFQCGPQNLVLQNLIPVCPPGTCMTLSQFHQNVSSTQNHGNKKFLTLLICNKYIWYSCVALQYQVASRLKGLSKVLSSVPYSIGCGPTIG